VSDASDLPTLHPLLASRWSPTAFDADHDEGWSTVELLLEAARWAPSYGNTQPARYLVGPRGTDTFDRILACLNTGNRGWAFRAGALLVSCAETANAKGEVPYAEYGVGLATENLVLQAVAEGLVAHQMAGFDAAAVVREFGLPATVRPLTAVAVGVLGPVELLAPEKRERETRPRTRLAPEELWFTGTWGDPWVTRDGG
jgi:nitroreductase